MLKPQELRIGNLVLINGLRTKVSLLVLKHLIENNIQFTVEGIPLTEEILLKCGFEKHHPEGSLYSLPWTLTSLNDGKKIDKNFSVALFDEFFVACQCQNTHLKYLHELQNLFYFTSQGQELNTIF